VTLHVHEWGDPGGPPLVCLHGITAHGARFRRLAEERLSRLRVVAPDLRGHGRSEWEPPWRLDRHVEDVLGTVSALGIEEADWLGHSFGGRLALELAAAAPARVRRLVLLDPALWVPPPVALERAEEAREDVSFGSPEEAVEHRLASGTVLHTPRGLLEEEAETHLERGGDGRLRFRYSRAAVVATYGEMSTAPVLEVHVPTLVVRGASSQVCPDPLLDLLRAAGGDLLRTVVDVPGGHTVLWDAFAETADAITRFLNGSV
jgi:lipase